MHVRCSYCRQSFNLSPEYVAEAIRKALAKKHRYVTVECINCRKQIKVSVAEMQRYAPTAEAEAPIEPETPAEAETPPSSA